MNKELIRTVKYNPYITNEPIFTLKLFDLNERDSWGKRILAYEFLQDDEAIFKGSDFHCSPLYSIDSDEAVKGLLSFLTLRPGDTDEEYFDDYTARQLEFCNEHAETLSIYCYDEEG